MTFRLRTLLIGMAVVAVMLFLLFASPPLLTTPLLATVWVGLAAFLTAGIVFGRGAGRAFCMGAMFPVGGTIFALSWLLFSLLISLPDNRPFKRMTEEFVRIAFAFRVWSAMGGAMTLLAGVAAVSGRFLFAPARSDTPADSI